MIDLDVPTSGQFSASDLHALWLAGKELASWRSRLALSAKDDAYAAPELNGKVEVLADWHALEACAMEARRLLADWPTMIGRELRWVPVGVGGGFEDLAYTEREVGRVGYLVQSNETVLATRSARWFGRGELVTLATVSSLASEVLALVSTTLGDTDRASAARITAPIERVAATASGARNGHDPDPSSWPVPFIRFAAACMRTLTELLARARGDQAVPLLDTDELYEAWLAVAVRDLLDDSLGARQSPSKGALASWHADATTIDLRIKPTFARSTELGRDTYRGLVAQVLVPDVVISATRGDYTEVAVLDAKAWTQMRPESVLSESAKYLYGIRRLGSEHLPVIACVKIVSCAPEPALHDAGEAHVAFVRATPTVGSEQLGSAVDEVLKELGRAIERREREASLL